jgi:hypothetical protein
MHTAFYQEREGIDVCPNKKPTFFECIFSIENLEIGHFFIVVVVPNKL